MSGIGSARRAGGVRAAVLVRIGTLVAVLATLVLGSAAAADAAGTGLDVYVGYMDTHTDASSSRQPTPWPYTDPSRYVGTPCPNYGSNNACWDASAIRLVNNGDTDLTGIHVVVTMGKTVYDLWGSNLTVKANSDLVLTETGASPNSENFDGSDFAPNAYNGGLQASCTNSGAYPVVTVTVGGSTTTYNDTGQVLNAGGVDGGHCENGTFVPGRMDESHPWALIGTAPAGGGGSGGGSGGGTTTTAPSAPTGVKAVAGDASVALTWSAPTNNGGSPVTGYQILRGTTVGGESTLTTVTSTSYTDIGLINGTKYYYKVIAVNAVGPSPASHEASATPQATVAAATAPSAPRGLTATVADGSVTLTWTPPSSDGGSAITGYTVLRGTKEGTEAPLGNAPAGSTSYTDTSVSNGATYYYTVEAMNGVGTSPRSNEVSAVPQAASQPPPGGSGGGPGPAPDPGPVPAPQPPPATAPSVPSGVSATAADGVVRLSWAAPSSDGGSAVSGYRVYRGTVSGGEAVIGEVSGTDFTDHGVRNGTTYFYTVAALNDVGQSAQSDEVSATPRAGASAPPVRVCAGLPGCRVMAHADVNGDGHRDVIALARRGGGPGSRGALILRVKVGPRHIVQTRRLLENWTGSPWLGVSRLDGRRGKEIVVGRLMGAAASFYQAITWRHGLLVRLDAPGRGRWWSVEFSATLVAGWQRRATDPVGTVRRRIATHGPKAGPYQGTIKTYQWTRSGWRLVQTGRVASLPVRRAQRWGGFDVPGLRRG